MEPKTVQELIEMGAIIKIPYKSQLDEWYSNVDFYKIKGSYYIHGGSARSVICKNFEEAYEIFSSFFDNIGLLQLKVMEENPEINFEDNFEELKRLVKEKQTQLI